MDIHVTGCKRVTISMSEISNRYVRHGTPVRIPTLACDGLLDASHRMVHNEHFVLHITLHIVYSDSVLNVLIDSVVKSLLFLCIGYVFLLL